MYEIGHITDIHRLKDEDIAQFLSEMPGLISSLRMAHRAAQATGIDLKDIFPVIKFDPEIKDEIIVRASFEGESVEVRGGIQQMIDADKRDLASSDAAKELIEKSQAAARDRPRP